MRDVEIHGNDVVVATHGRGFWVLDDISLLRQLNTDTSVAAAVLFKPADAIAVVQGGDNGTPWQKDEPQAENAPVGAAIDYYLKSPASGPLTIEVIDSSGRVVRTMSSTTAASAPVTPQNVSVLWRRLETPPSTAAGQHRWVWDLRQTPPAGGGQGRGNASPMLVGTFTVKLTANGQSYTQPLVVRPDPRTR